MDDTTQVDVLLIWVNAERQFEQEFIDAINVHPDLSRPTIVERDSHQVEIAVGFPDKTDILEAIIDSLLQLPGYDISIQGAEKERVPTVVFRATPTSRQSRLKRQRTRRKHFDEAVIAPSAGTRRPVQERVLSTTEIAMTSGSRSGIRVPARDEPLAEIKTSRRHNKANAPGARNLGGVRQSRVLPLLMKIARILFTEPQEREIATALNSSDVEQNGPASSIRDK